MAKSFWEELKKPIFALAPMAGVTDRAFRQIIAKYGKPDVMFTEFVSANGLCSQEGRKALAVDLKFSQKERPIVCQLFGANSENFFAAAEYVRKLGFDGIDINMGCPDKNVLKQGAGAALIKNPKLAQEILRMAKKGARDLPVSVKTRIGFERNSVETWIHALLEECPAAVTVHGRTKKELSLVPTNWGAIAQAVKIRNKKKSRCLILGNGDVKDLADAREKVRIFSVDGVMIGRAVFGNPWLFSARCDRGILALKDRLHAMQEHAFLFERLFSGKKNFSMMRKHFQAYARGFSGAKELRFELMKTENAQEAHRVVYSFLSKL